MGAGGHLHAQSQAPGPRLSRHSPASIRSRLHGVIRRRVIMERGQGIAGKGSGNRDMGGQIKEGGRRI